MLVDIVSKNGNLLLNIPVKGDGTIDADEEAFLQGMAKWMDVNSEGIYATRPWKVYGEGPSVTEQAEAGTFGGERDVRSKPYTSEDVRFTAKGDTLYAFVMEWPSDGRVNLRSLGLNAKFDRGIAAVSLLGSKDSLEWVRNESGVQVTLPATRPCAEAFTLKIALQQ